MTRRATCPVCDQIVPTVMRGVRKRGVVECFAAHPNPHPAAVGYKCCESGGLIGAAPTVET